MTAWIVVIAVAPAHAVGGRVTTHVDPCVPIERAQFDRLLALELGSDIQASNESDDPTTGEAPNLAVVTLSCVDAGVQLRLDDLVTRKSMMRTVDFARVEPESRSRLMALTVAEFVVASWLELRLPATQAVAPVGPPPSAATERRAAGAVERRLPAAPAPAAMLERQTSTQLTAAFEASSFFSKFRPIPCGALRVTHQLAPAFGLGASLQVGRAPLEGKLGVRRESVVVQLTTISLLANVLYLRRAGDFEFSAGGGVRIGLFAAAGETPEMDTTVEAADDYVPWAAPVVLVGLTYRAGPRLRVVTHFEAGLLKHVRVFGDDSVVAELRHGWAGVSLGIGWSL